MKTFCQILLLIIILVSCKSEKQKQFEKDIIGEWSFAKYVELEKQENYNQILEEPPSPFFRNVGGFVFKENGTLMDETGFFDFDEGKSREERRILYKGDSTNYKINDDSLKIFNPIEKSWNKYKIISVTNDTLTLQKNQGYYLKYYKQTYKPKPNETFDKIIISSSGCYGTCAILSVEFNKNGKVFYLGEKYNTVNGFYTSNISNFEYEKIENSFKKANIMKLKNSYSDSVSDSNTITVTFVKDNKIVKTISDYASQAPPELIMAYRKAMFKYQLIKLSKFETNKNLVNPTFFNLYIGEKLIFLEQSERFLLLNGILNGEKVHININEKYRLKFSDVDKDFTIKTDGRFYKYQNQVYDIGYNFIEINNLEKRTSPSWFVD
ncbi:hypothetical protein IO90_05100 [Chryseobacterium sp. FH1]|nr:hypothetical protein IO90_05100 [Chryseobacterium sp. FH1]